jgi:C-terminal processing protease CtpA/Prc
VTIGKGTWRKGTVQAQIPQNDGSLVKMTISEYLIGSPTNWIAVQCVGVNPDIEYEAKGTIKPKKEIHECDIEGAVASGGKSSDPNAVPVPLFDRDPARYMIGLDMRDAVEVFDNKKLDKYERIKKLLKMEDRPPTE